MNYLQFICLLIFRPVKSDDNGHVENLTAPPKRILKISKVKTSDLLETSQRLELRPDEALRQLFLQEQNCHYFFSSLQILM